MLLGRMLKRPRNGRRTSILKKARKTELSVNITYLKRAIPVAQRTAINSEVANPILSPPRESSESKDLDMSQIAAIIYQGPENDSMSKRLSEDPSAHE